MADSSRHDPGVVAQRLDHLFRTVHPKNRAPYTYQEVADGINTAAGEKIISPSYLWQLRKGTRAEPSHNRLAAIAKFFGVPLTYFTDDQTARETDEQLELLVALRDQGVQHLAMRAAGLSAGSLQAILAMIENARKIEKLPEGPA
jgi:transcriptional regulator with XRE-family HTH domain